MDNKEEQQVNLALKSPIGKTLDRFRHLAKIDPKLFDLDERHVYKFVNGSIPRTYSEESPQSAQIVASYNQESRRDYLLNILSQLPNIKLGGEGGWLGMGSKGVKLNWRENKWPRGSRSLPDGGRIYINPKPHTMDVVFYELAKLMNSQPDVPFDAKVMGHGSMVVSDLNRGDKMVLYFNPKDQAVILKVVQELYRKVSPQVFDKITPVFAMKLLDESGQIMEGISFGQEPSGDLEAAFTFNNLRETTLYNLKNSLNAPDFEDQFKGQLQKYRVDPAFPAFNLPLERGRQLYPVMLANAA